MKPDGAAELNTHLAEDGGGESSDNAAPEVDAEFGRAAQRLERVVGHAAVHDLVAELVHSELADRVGDLPARRTSARNIKNGDGDRWRSKMIQGDRCSE